MDDLLKKIIEADLNQQQRIVAAEAQRRTAEESIAKRIAELKQQYAAHAEKRIAMLREAQAIYADETIAKQLAHDEEILRRLEEAFDINREKWAEELANRVIGG